MQLNTKETIHESLSKYPILQKAYQKLTLRHLVQYAVVFIMLYAAWQFWDFLQYIRVSPTGELPTRPPVVEGFLPIAAIVALISYIKTGIIDPIHPAGLVILFAALFTAWLFRRALCSWICPIGTLSEHLAALGRKVFGRNYAIPKWLDVILLIVKYGIFIFIIRMFFSMSADDAISFMQLPYYAISDIKMFDFFTKISAIGVAVIFGFMLLSMLFKSFWCRYLCPYGAVLGILGFLSPIVLTKNNETCIKCGKCNQACPSRVDVMGKDRLVATTECNGCTSCVTACPKRGTLEFKFLGFLPIKPLYFGIGFVVVFFGIILLAKLTGHWESIITIEQYQQLDALMSGGFGGMMQ